VGDYHHETNSVSFEKQLNEKLNEKLIHQLHCGNGQYKLPFYASK
jgi:hypothetical protein